MKRKWKIPNTFVIVYSIIILAAIATWIVPGGTYERQTITDSGSERRVLVRDSFTYHESIPQYFAVFEAPLKGVIRMADIIGFIFLVGGAFYVFQKTGAINAAIGKIVKIMQGHEK